MSQQNTRIRNAILGAAVADAATLGFHWLYDQERIHTLEPEAPEFHPLSVSDYKGVMGYFAHAHKQSGDFSQYGAQMMTMLRSLMDNGGSYEKSLYESHFREHFGYGGAYIGYIDHPTRDTLDNITRAENDALMRARAIRFNGADTMKQRLVTKVLASAKQASGAALRVKVEEAVRTTDDDDYLVAHAFKMLEEWEKVGGYHGANDEQLPAVSKLPPLVAAHIDDDHLQDMVESAVRVTNNTDLAVAIGQSAARMLQSCFKHGDPNVAISASLENADAVVSELIESALALENEMTPAVTKKTGMACELVYGVPSIIHNVSNSNSYREAIRQNIYSGGDSCGRSILIGAVMGACHGIGGNSGIPQDWIDKLTQKQQLCDLLKYFEA